MIEIVRTDSTDLNFMILFLQLDMELNDQYGVKQSYYGKLKKMACIPRPAHHHRDMLNNIDDDHPVYNK